MKQRASSQALLGHTAGHASPLSRKPGSPDGPEAQTSEHLQCRSQTDPSFIRNVEWHFKALSETNMFVSYNE